MFDKLKIAPEIKDVIMKITVVIIIAAIAILSLDVFTTGTDGRRQIIDDDGGIETSLIEILSDIKGAGEVDVMIKYDDKDEVTGVIVTSSGAGNIVVKNNLTNAVSAVFNIPVSNVMVFEKENGGLQGEQK